MKASIHPTKLVACYREAQALIDCGWQILSYGSDGILLVLR